MRWHVHLVCPAAPCLEIGLAKSGGVQGISSAFRSQPLGRFPNGDGIVQARMMCGSVASDRTESGCFSRFWAPQTSFVKTKRR
jgi:hypothetical protein